MKKYLLSVLTSLVLIPSVSNAVAQINDYSKQQTNQKIINNLKNDNSKIVEENGKIDWDAVNSKVDNEILNNTNGSIFKDQAEKDKIESTVKQYTTDFKAKNYSLDDANQYFQTNNADFKKNFTNKSPSMTNVKDKINNEYFSSTKIDLSLDGSNTYQDAVNALINKINNEYGISANITLTNKSQATQTLFSADSDSISNFVNNNITINLNLQIGSDKAQTVTLALTNVQLNPTTDALSLDQCVKWYFNQLNPQDLNLTSNSTRADALNNLVNKIDDRFNIKIGNDLNSSNGIQVSLVNSGAANSKFIDDSNLNYVFNKNMWFDVNVRDNYLSSDNNQAKESLYLSNIKFDFTNMTLALSRLFMTGASKNNLQNLGVNTDNTFQDVIADLNNNFSKLDTTDQFVVSLVDPSQATKKLQTEYVPGQPENFFANVNIGFNDNGSIVNLGTSTIYLGNVKLSPTAQKILEAYNQDEKTLETLKTVRIALETAAILFSVTSCALFIAGYFDPALLPTAWGLTIADYTLVVANGALGIYEFGLEEKLDSLSSIADLTWDILAGFGRVYGGAIFTCLTATVFTLETLTFTGLVAGIIETILGLLFYVYQVLKYFNVPLPWPF